MLTNEQVAARRARIDRYVRPFQRFVEMEAAGGLVLLAAAVVALVWANSPWSLSYSRLIGHHIVIDLGFVTHDHSLQAWINEGAMALFFFVVGLEIKREAVVGELASLSRLVVPVAAAIGGMLTPALIFAMIARGTDAAPGWGIPMATDIAFAVGVLALLGTRIPVGLKVLLLALAIVDDIGAIIVIGLFYAGDVALVPIGIAGATLVAAFVLRQVGLWYIPAYFFLGIVGWLAMMESGLHPTLIGVAFGLLTPWRAWYRPEALIAIADSVIARVRVPDARRVTEDAHSPDVGPFLHLSMVSTRAVSPLDLLEHHLVPLVAFVIVPLFAFANAGVVLSGEVLGGAFESPATLGIIAGLVIGKPTGITVAVWLATRAGASVPSGVTWPSLVGIGLLGGIGFTVSLLIADLAFDDPLLTDQAKIGILVGSLIAGVAGFVLLRAVTRPAINEPESVEEARSPA